MKDVYAEKVNEYLLKRRLEQLEEYDNYIQWLCQFVSEDRWDEVYDEIAKMVSTTGDLVTCERLAADGSGSHHKVKGYVSEDGVCHLELPSIPDSILVRLPDRRGREVFSAKVYRYARDDEQ